LRRTSCTAATGTGSCAIARRTRTPRTSSWPIDPSTNAAKANIASASGFCCTSIGSSATTVITAHTIGTMKLRRTLDAVARRHAITGPMPESSTSTSASGTV
jgi:hypothetical protein